MDRKTALQAVGVFTATLIIGMPFALRAGEWLAGLGDRSPVAPAPPATGWGTRTGDGTDTAEQPPVPLPGHLGNPSPSPDGSAPAGADQAVRASRVPPNSAPTASPTGASEESPAGPTGQPSPPATGDPHHSAPVAPPAPAAPAMTG